MSPLSASFLFGKSSLSFVFKERFPQLEYIYLPDQPGNYRKTLRENNDTLERLSWKPEDRLNDYIQSL